jgi:signal transduction histidine kinase
MADSLARAALGALAAELGHELQGPLNLFRLATDRLALGERLDGEDVDLLREELERLSRVTARLRDLSRSTVTRTGASPAQLLAAAGIEPEPELELAVDATCSIECDPDLVGLALRALLENAKAARAQRCGIRFSVAKDRCGFCVWDDGAGFALEVERALAWAVSTKPGAAGMGLTLVLRVARAHGFALELDRSAGRTEAWLLIPARALQVGAARLEP